MKLIYSCSLNGVIKREEGDDLLYFLILLKLMIEKRGKKLVPFEFFYKIFKC